MNTHSKAFFAIAATLLVAPTAQASIYAVGPLFPGTGCTHSTLRAALTDAAATPGGPHTIKVAIAEDKSLSYSYGDPDLGEFELIDPSPQYIFVRGGYPSCNAANPTAGAETLLAYLTSSVDANHSLLSINNSSDIRFYVSFDNIHFQGADSPASVVGPSFGGAMKLYGNVTATIGLNSRISGFKANIGGGGVAIFQQSLQRPILQMNPGSVISDNVSHNDGGGLYSLLGRVYIRGATVENNIAEVGNGGGIYISDSARDGNIATNPLDAALAFEGNVTSTIRNNHASFATASLTRGLGGGIYSSQGWIFVQATSLVPGHTLKILQNEANHGGGIYIEGPEEDAGGPYTDLLVYDTLFELNYARGTGGGIYAMDAVNGEFDSSGKRCESGGHVGPCSAFLLNGAGNEDVTSGLPPGGGAIFLSDERGDGVSWPFVRFKRTLFAGNQDFNGSAAVAVADSHAQFSFHRSIFLDNAAPDNSALIYSDNDKDVDFRYNTVLPNNTTRAFGIYGSATLLLQGSIVWMPGHTTWYHGASTTMISNGCLLLNSNLDVPALATVGDPKLGADFAPRGSSPALDFCDSFGYTPATDTYLQFTRDVVGITNKYYDVLPDARDLGAVEQTDIIYANNFGERADLP